MARKREPGYIFIPPEYSAIYKLEVIRSDGVTTDDVTELIMSAEVEDGVTEGIGKFQFTIPDPGDDYKNVWTGMEVFNYYKDYDSTAITKRFRGRIEKVSYNDDSITVRGRSETLFLMDITVTASFNNELCGIILKSIIDKYGGGRFTYGNVNNSTIPVTVNWYQKPFWECVEELCDAAGFDCYCDSSLDFHYFEEGTVVNYTEGIVHDYNLLEVSDFSQDVAQIKNRVIVYGAEQDGIQIVYTAENLASQATYGVKEMIVNNDNLTNYYQAKDYADNLLAANLNPPIEGDIKGILLATQQPGESIFIFSPTNNLLAGFRRIKTYKDTLSQDGLFTTVKIEKEPLKISHILKKVITDATKKQNVSSNPYEMRYSYDFLFDSDSGTHTGTEITNGVLKLQTGEATGNWVSPTRDLTASVTQAYLNIVGQTLTSAVVEVSGDGGIIYDVIASKTRINLTVPGTQLRVRVSITDANTQVDSLGLQYKTV